MNLFCKLFGHTWVHKSENPKISWNTAKSLNELALTAHGEPKFWIECQRCGERRDDPTRDEIRALNA